MGRKTRAKSSFKRSKLLSINLSIQGWSSQNLQSFPSVLNYLIPHVTSYLDFIIKVPYLGPPLWKWEIKVCLNISPHFYAGINYIEEYSFEHSLTVFLCNQDIVQHTLCNKLDTYFLDEKKFKLDVQMIFLIPDALPNSLPQACALIVARCTSIPLWTATALYLNFAVHVVPSTFHSVSFLWSY